MLTNISPFTGLLLMVAVLFLVAMVLVGLAIEFREFSQELKYLNCEIRRTTGEARKNWKRKRRRLWLSLLPFFW